MDPSAPESVHLGTFPQADPAQIDEELATATRLAMRLSSLGRSARSRAKIKVRQPLRIAKVNISFPNERELFPRIKDQVAGELNVEDAALFDDIGEVAKHFELRLDMSKVGPRFGKQVSQLNTTFNVAVHDEAGHTRIYRSVVEGTAVGIGEFTLQPEEVQVTLTDVEGYSASMEGGYLVAVATDIPEGLYREGLARELVHRIQGMRRSAGLDIADYIVTYYKGDEELEGVMEAFGGYISRETLSRRLIKGVPPEGSYTEEQRIDGLQVRLGVRVEQG